MCKRAARDGRQRVTLRVTLERDGFVVLNDFFYRGWVADVTPGEEESARRVPILRANRIMRAVALPAGQYTVNFLYRPTGFYWGAAISAMSWLAFVAMICLPPRSAARQRRDAIP